MALRSLLLVVLFLSVGGSFAVARDGGFGGLWETRYGRMHLVIDGDRATGRYSEGDGEVDGRVDASTLTFRYADNDGTGEGEFQLGANRRTFSGKWRKDGSEEWSPWDGVRVVPQEGITWLVILEAHWERSLAESEYAFGDMLRGYFSMADARHVRVRHRYFHDEPDLRRFCRELEFLAEPVVLLISSHGNRNGLEVNGTTISAASIAEPLRGTSNLKLLHLSGCSMFAGDVPQEIQRRFPAGRRFPISGYTTDVAWDASAIADFTYLSMLLLRGLSPQKAVRQTHLVAPFTGSRPVVGSEFESLGLKVLLPIL